MPKRAVNFTGSAFTNKATGFVNPTMLPQDNKQKDEWQKANKTWWETTPMRYDWRADVPHAKFSSEYFAEIDRRFLSSVREYLPWKERPFEQLIPYAKLSSMDVLEIGVGQGTHAQLIAPHCRSFTGIDLTEAATEAASIRLERAGIAAIVKQMDAECMRFPDASFDYIWSWGVIHHSADTLAILREMHRVLRPEGQATVMVYHRNWWNVAIVNGFLRGIVQGRLGQDGGLHGVMQSSTDGAIARFYTTSEWVHLNNGLFDVDTVRIFGSKSDVVPLPPGRLKSTLLRIIPDAATRFATNTMRMGNFLVASMRRASAFCHCRP